ncbi:hypothetical protein QI633_08160 [Nocardioides sp. QY071]|uniref:hypothetical protein n=1 Tax=Nocardioides sp. QY071 TaxID=3044187 RepID=UPI00249AD06F|nr:hypothetical protein [Nocardioides sp. QY071]WGY03726.1 hypothetical protein QI633_08160 [Nocardioides sp. QY071]
MASADQLPPALRRARANLASAAAALKSRPTPAAAARVDKLRAEYNVLALEDRIHRVLDDGPPLSDAQRTRLVAAVQRKPKPAATAEPKDWLTLAEAAAVLGTTSVQVRQLADVGTLRSRILPGSAVLLVRRSDAVDAMGTLR